MSFPLVARAIEGVGRSGGTNSRHNRAHSAVGSWLKADLTQYSRQRLVHHVGSKRIMRNASVAAARIIMRVKCMWLHGYYLANAGEHQPPSFYRSKDIDSRDPSRARCSFRMLFSVSKSTFSERALYC